MITVSQVGSNGMKRELEQAVAGAVKNLFNVDVGVELTRPDEQFGDFATNVALRLAQAAQKNPREIAEQLKAKLTTDLSSKVSEITVAGPGFLNIRLSDAALVAGLKADVSVRWDMEAVIETNNPNPFKAMHIGHAFNAILADTIANLLGSGGARAHRVSYHGDVGLHVGKSMWSLLRYVNGNPAVLAEIKEADRNSFMSRMYAEGAAAYEQNEQAKVDIDSLTQQSFTLSDPLYKEVYETCKHWSFQQIDAIVHRLGNKPTVRRYLESEADFIGVQTVHQHVPDVFVQSNGALVFPGSKYGSFDNVYVTGNGLGLYGARDLGLMQLKHRDFPDAQKSYIVTAEEQRDYFKGVIKAAELCLPALTGVTQSISTGTVKLTSGKMSSRSGDVLEIDWLFEQIGKAVVARGGEATDDVLAGALRYQFLKVRIGSDVVFNVAEAVSLAGNSGPYLQYAHARARSILSKALTTTRTQHHESHKTGVEVLDAPDPQKAKEPMFQPGERSLARKIGEYGEVADKAITDLLPHHICTYLYELAQVFNSFYEHNRVIDDDRETVRLQLVTAYANTLKKGLDLLGIQAPEHM